MATNNEESNAVRFLKDFIAGTVAGWAQVLVGQPFDTVKVRLQTQRPDKQVYNGPVDCAKQILAKEGPLGFYKGTLVPLLGVGACVSVQFVALSQAKKFFLGDDVNRPLGFGELFLAGAFAGLVNSVLSAPIEHIRIRQQVNAGATSSPFALIKDIAANHGWQKIWKGFVPTACREIGYGSYFVTYELLVRASIPEGKTVNDVHPALLILAGGCGGAAMWVSTYPIDVIKSRIQADALSPAQAHYKGFADCAKYIWRVEGMRGFWRGFIPCLLRAFPVNGATFAAYELTMRLMGGRSY